MTFIPSPPLIGTERWIALWPPVITWKSGLKARRVFQGARKNGYDAWAAFKTTYFQSFRRGQCEKMCSVLANMATSNNKTEITNSNNSSNDNATNIEDRETIIRTHSEIRSADQKKKINYQVTSFSIIVHLLSRQSHLLFLSEVSKSSDSLCSQWL